jgi:NADPH:quinone reductase-like Zn-dependent oxidoreductase
VTPQSLRGIAEAVEQGKLAPTIGRTVPLSEAIPALIELEKTSLPSGKLVVIPE